MYDKIKAEVSQDYYRNNYPNEGTRFVAWYLRNIHLLDEVQARDCITDGKDDKQIDAIYIDSNAQKVYVVQGKFIGGSPIDAEPLREVLSSWILLKTNKIALQEGANAKLQQKLPELIAAVDEGYDICFELIATSSPTEGAKADLAVFQQEMMNSDDFCAEFHLVDNEGLSHRYDMALDKDNPYLEHGIDLQPGRFLRLKLGSTDAVIAVLPLKDCIKFPGIKDGALFAKNVRKSLGLNPVNKKIRETICSSGNEFFFFHNGITAICESLSMTGDTLHLKGLSVVNGCQSLSTILSCSETVKGLEDAFIMCRFYAIPERTRSDKISNATNFQTAVKARDLRSNDKRVLAIKKAYEQRYPSGYMVTKRGEAPPANKDKKLVVDLSDLGKYLLAWHSQRPNISYSEAKIFDKYFEQLFRSDYSPEKICALNELWQVVWSKWDVKAGNPLKFNESLLPMKAYAPNHHMYAVSCFFSVSNGCQERVPNPYTVVERLKSKNMLDELVGHAGTCLNMAFVTSSKEVQENKVFSPQNWIKTKGCLASIRMAVSQYQMMMPNLPGGTDLASRLEETLRLSPNGTSVYIATV